MSFSAYGTPTRARSRPTADHLCNACVSDAECKPGQRCAREVYEETELGYRCFWERGAVLGGAPANCPSARRYVATKIDATSIDGATGDLCTRAISTCKAHEDFRNVDCEASDDVPDASLCGEPDLERRGLRTLRVAGT